MDIWEVRKKKEDERRKRYSELASKITENRIDYIVNVITKEVRREHRLVLQILYALFSIYTLNPINLAINAPSGLGKTYAVKNVTKYFEVGDDIQHLGGMTEKSLFHRKGIIVIQEDEGIYVPIDNYITEITDEIDEINEQIKEAETKSEKTELRERKRELEEQLKLYQAEAIKCIDLRRKALIFQDTPDPLVLEAMMPLLSHDQPRVFYEFVNKDGKITTTQNMLEGWPSVIYCQAIDGSGRDRWPELLRRFIICNPEMSKEKYGEAIDQIFKGSLTDGRYEKEVITKEEKETVKALIFEIVDSLKQYFLDADGSVIMPFRSSIRWAFKDEGSFDMAVAKKTHDLLVLLPIINMRERPYLLIPDEKNPKKIPFCTLKDLKDALYINEFIFGGLRQDILQWYISVFYHVWNRKKANDDLDAITKGNEVITEPKPIVFLSDLVNRTKEVYGGEELPEKEIYKRFLLPIINHGYVDELQSVTNPRKKVYYPTSHEIIKRYEVINKELKLKEKLQIYNEEYYPTKRYMTAEIEKELNANDDSKLFDADGKEITIDDLIEKYYSDPDAHFARGEELSDSDIDKITRAGTSSTPTMNDFTPKTRTDPVTEKCDACGLLLTTEEMPEHKKYECRKKSKLFT